MPRHWDWMQWYNQSARIRSLGYCRSPVQYRLNNSMQVA